MKKKHTAEQVVGKLREAELELAKGRTIAEVVRNLSITEQTYYRWRKEYGGLRTDQTRRITSEDVLERLTDLFIRRAVPDHIRSDNGVEFTAQTVREWLMKVGVKTLFIEPGSPWENGYVESFNGKLRDELLNGEIFYTLPLAKVLIERWRKHYNQARPHCALGYRPSAPERIPLPEAAGDSAPEPPTSKPPPESTGEKTCIRALLEFDGLT